MSNNAPSQQKLSLNENVVGIARLRPDTLDTDSGRQSKDGNGASCAAYAQVQVAFYALL